jgi:hypothetical protein
VPKGGPHRGDVFLVEQSAKACLVEIKTKWAILWRIFELSILYHNCGVSRFFISYIYANGGSVSTESKTTEPKICGRCPKAVKDTPALKRHCSEVHKQDIYGNPISIELFACRITTCRKHTEPFKRREKLAQHIRTFHTEIIEGQDVNGGISSRERDAALTTNNAANVGNHSGGNYGAARMSARAHHDSDEVGAWYPTVFGEPIDVQSAPVANSCEMGLCYVRSQILQQWKTFRANVFRLQIYQ